ncbi:hypothetical protein NDU88_006217 [Pleurodeles waltl]|uniref:Uncharacterized protein n=1 Tax=Pleurodeles waltl TaxID=8319 RepID=A0AAV7LU96_PLEWA|nr:hypothetical protein NDU88_006217 [Pleurodeles waltl]
MCTRRSLDKLDNLQQELLEDLNLLQSQRRPRELGHICSSFRIRFEMEGKASVEFLECRSQHVSRHREGDVDRPHVLDHESSCFLFSGDNGFGFLLPDFDMRQGGFVTRLRIIVGAVALEADVVQILNLYLLLICITWFEAFCFQGDTCMVPIVTHLKGFGMNQNPKEWEL